MSARTPQPMTRRPDPWRADEGPPEDASLSLGLLPSYVGFHLRLAQLASIRNFAEGVGTGEEITPALFGVLEVIAANPGMSQGRVAEAHTHRAVKTRPRAQERGRDARRRPQTSA